MTSHHYLFIHPHSPLNRKCSADNTGLLSHLHSIPLHATDAGNESLLLLSQHVLGSMPKLVEQGLHLPACGCSGSMTMEPISREPSSKVSS